MNRRIVCVAIMCVLGLVSQVRSEEPKSSDGFVAIFDGKTLKGWSGNATNWSVQDEAITGISTAEKPLDGNTFIVWDKPVSNFELRLEYRIIGGNSGIQYRSKLVDKDKFIVGGYQADIDSTPTFSGINYDERGRGILAKRGEAVLIAKDGSSSVVRQLGSAEELQKKIKNEEWNHYRLVANGSLLQHYINDTLMSEVDDKSDKSVAEGILALQLHAGPPMKVQFRKIYIKSL